MENEKKIKEAECLLKIFKLMQQKKFVEAENLLPWKCQNPTEIWWPSDLNQLVFAATDGYDILEHLFKGGEDIERRKGWYEYTPLHVAVNAGNEECCEILLKRGADIEANDKVMFYLSQGFIFLKK